MASGWSQELMHMHMHTHMHTHMHMHMHRHMHMHVHVHVHVWPVMRMHSLGLIRRAHATQPFVSTREAVLGSGGRDSVGGICCSAELESRGCVLPPRGTWHALTLCAVLCAPCRFL